MDEMKNINLDSYGNVLPDKNDKIALIDADTLVYTACLRAEQEIMLNPKESYTDEEWSEIMNNPTYDEGANSIWESNLDDVIKFAEEKLKKIMDLTGCQKYELHFSYGKENFRYKLYPEYKLNRKYIRRPCLLNEAKEHYISKGGFKHTFIEADDAVVWLKRNYPEKYILCCVDKDVYNAVPGEHFNYYESGTFNKDMHWVSTSEKEAEMWPYKQAIIGDKSDNIIGLKGIGLAKVKNYIKEDGDYRQQLLDAYKAFGRTEQEALLNLALVTCGDNKIMKDYFKENIVYMNKDLPHVY